MQYYFRQAFHINLNAHKLKKVTNILVAFNCKKMHKSFQRKMCYVCMHCIFIVNVQTTPRKVFTKLLELLNCFNVSLLIKTFQQAIFFQSNAVKINVYCNLETSNKNVFKLLRVKSQVFSSFF